MKKIFLILLFLLLFPLVSYAASSASICFCHTQSANPVTICTSKSGEQNGHTNHGDLKFGCECGDGICNSLLGETCSTCPSDCGTCVTCGNGIVNPPEECGEPGLSCSTGECVGCRCLTLCGNDVVDYGEECDGGTCCNTDCTLDTTSPGCIDNCPNDPSKTEPGICGCGVPDTDSDGDGSADCIDQCPQDDNKIIPGICGCGVSDMDTDGDGTADCLDQCPDDMNKVSLGVCGCGVPDTDTDGDQTPDCIDNCTTDPAKIDQGQCGCGVADTDSDGDGTANCNDQCPGDVDKIYPGICGCGMPDVDTDGDGVPDCNDQCPEDADKTQPGQCGCGVADTDTDQDGSADCNDPCPEDPTKTSPGLCGCGMADIDTDDDGVPNCNDQCPEDAEKTQPGQCGCGALDTDTDQDGIVDCIDQCPANPNKYQPGLCGCEIDDTDSDQDGLANCNDICPEDPGKTLPGICGCGIADTDSDGDGTANCRDQCPGDETKATPGVCGCGLADVDTDGDGRVNCEDVCPNDPDKTQPGQCGCGVSDLDIDQDGIAQCNDQCPNDPEKGSFGICGCGVSDVDVDGDGVCDNTDNCPTVPNPNQADTDDNNVGDACEPAPQVAPPPGGVGAAGGRNCHLHENENFLKGDFNLVYFIIMMNGMILGLRLKRSRHLVKVSGGFLVIVMVLISTGSVWALNTQKWRPSTGQVSGQVVQTSEVLPKYHFATGLNVNFVQHPFEQTPAHQTTRLNGLVDQFITADVLIEYGLADWVSISLDAPFNFYHNIAPTFIPTRDKGGADFGDLQLSAKFQVYDAKKTSSGLGLALVPFVTVPTGDEKIYFGEDSVTGGLLLAGDYRFYDNRLALNLGAKLRSSETVSSLRVKNELLYGLSYQRPLSLDWNLDIIAEAFGSTNISGHKFVREDITSPLEGDLTLRKRWGDNKRLVTDLGAGAGITNGYGLPLYRIFTGISYAWDLSPKENPQSKKYTIDIPTEILFDFDKSDIKPSAFPILDRFADQLSKLTNARITVEGHTDSKGSDDYNMKLSQKRAYSIKNYMVSKGVTENMMSSIGYGESRPVASNDTDEGRQKNRRCVFVVDQK